MNFGVWVLCAWLSCIFMQRHFKSNRIGMAWGCFLMSGVGVFAAPWTRFPQYPPLFRAAMDYNSLYAVVLLITAAATAILVPRRTLHAIFHVTAWLNTALIILGWFFQKILGYQIQGDPFNEPWGVLMNPSMSGCFAVCLMALFLDKPYLLLCSALAVILCGQDQPWVLLGIGAWIWAWQRRSELFPYIGLGLLGVGLAAIVDGVQSSGRFEVWRLSWNWWKSYGNPLTGTGSGGFSVIGPVLTRKMETLWIWMHSDWLQIGFEHGIFGLVLALLVLWKVIQSTREKPEVRLGVVLYALWMCANMPMRFPISAILGLYFLRLGLESEHG